MRVLLPADATGRLGHDGQASIAPARAAVAVRPRARRPYVGRRAGLPRLHPKRRHRAADASKGCGRVMRHFPSAYGGPRFPRVCSWACAYMVKLARSKVVRRVERFTEICDGCGERFVPKRSDARPCGGDGHTENPVPDTI